MYITVTASQFQLLLLDEAADVMQTVAATSLIPMEVDKVLSCMQSKNADGNIQDYATDTTPSG